MTGFVEAARREKLKELLERGVAPFAYRFERTASAQQALAAYKSDDDPTVHRVAGRLVALRPHGKQDASGVQHGELTDPELRYRQRYADLAVHAEVRAVFRLRTRIVQAIRAFL